MRTPRPTAMGLVATLALTVGALAAFLAGAPSTPEVYLVLFTALFAIRVAGQIVVAVGRPRWLPPMDDWNFVPYGLLLPVQLALIPLMVAASFADPGPRVATVLVALAFLYWAVMGARYAIRMVRRPDQRWLGGTIPIVFHCVLAAFVFVLGASHVV